MIKTKKFIVTLGLATVLTVGACITASAAAYAGWNNSSGSGYHYGVFFAESYDATWQTATLSGTYNETRSGGYHRSFSVPRYNTSMPSTPSYSSWGQTYWSGNCSGPVYGLPYGESASHSVTY